MNKTYKYVVESDYLWIRRNIIKYCWWPKGHYDYIEQKYYNTKEEAMKAFVNEKRYIRAWLEERRKLHDNCHEIVRCEQWDNNESNAHDVCCFIKNRFEDSREDTVRIRLRTVGDGNDYNFW